MIDNLDLRDDTGLAGYVVIIDNKTGKVLLKKHNMIVKEGRNYLLRKLFNGFSIKNPSVSNGEEVLAETQLKLGRIFFSNSINETKFEMKYNDIKNDINDFQLNFDDKDNSKSDSPIVLTIINTGIDTGTSEAVEIRNRPGMKIDVHLKEITASDDFELTSIASLGLLLTDTSQATKKLYSRIVFDPILLSDDSDFTITYYTYI